MKSCVLGLDTSNYTSSIAIIDQNKRVILDNRILLNVKQGQRGLRQSDALFQHIQNIPFLVENSISPAIKENIKCISVSNKPRPNNHSYMPVFLASQSYGKVIANVLNCQYREYSHQENHIEAAKWSSGFPNDIRSFIGVHLSGGTTEILNINKLSKRYSIDIVGGSMDISAGQLLDRIGVELGFQFPAGKYLDEISINTNNLLTLPLSVKDSSFNFSGLETKAYQLLSKNENKNVIVKSIMHSIAATLGLALKNICEKTNIKQILLFGGVASSNYIRAYLEEFAKNNKYEIYFGKMEYCTDAAIGTALLPMSFKEGEDEK